MQRIPRPGRSRLTRRILLGIVPLFLLFISLSVVLQNRFQEQEMLEQAQVSAHTYADIIRESLVSMMVSNQEVDSNFVGRLTQIREFDTLHIVVNSLRLRKELFSDAQLDRVAKKGAFMAPRDEREQTVLKTGKPVFVRAGEEFKGIIPFNATSVCQKCHAVPIGYTLGATALRVSLGPVSKAAAGNWKRSSIIFLVFTALVIAISSVMFARYVSRPIDGLVRATNEISRGNLDFSALPHGLKAHPGTVTTPPDELGFLALRFDEMRTALKEKIDQLDQANRTLSQRNAEVEKALSSLRQAQENLVRSERLAVTGRLTAQLSHEINNPIHNIQSLLDSTLRKVEQDSQAHELVSVALDEVARMAKLTRQMLDIYRDSVTDLEREPVEVAALVKDVARTNREQLASRKIDLRLDVRPPISMVRGSKDKLKQVLLNLVLNARDAMPDGGLLTLRTYAVNGAVRIEVQDTGIGIPEEYVGKIFEAFFTTKKQVSGVGLGLSVCYGIIQQHRGTISVTSVVGEGSTFTIELPSSGDHDG